MGVEVKIRENVNRTNIGERKSKRKCKANVVPHFFMKEEEVCYSNPNPFDLSI